jgi:pilus assembly protein FimV
MKIRFSLVLFLAIASGVVHALGLGKLQLESALNEPLKARIELLSATADEINSLNVSLADEAAFRRAGIPREYVLRLLSFSVKESEAGPDYILVHSNDPIREPFLNFLVEVNWSKGRLYREYTVLLDPPVYIAEEMRKKVTPPPVTTAKEAAPEVREEEQAVIYYPEYKPAKTPSPATTTPGLSQPTRPVEYTGGDYGPVASGETLWSIARGMRPDSSVSIQQMMLALVRTNPEAFINGNINGLKRGYVLKAPDLSEAQSLGKAEAFAQAQLQNSMWEETRQAIAAAPPVRPEGVPAQPEPVVSEEKPAEEVKEAKPAVVEGQPELRLVAPGEAGKSATQGGPAEPEKEALTKELALARESLEALNLENTELKDKISESDAIVGDLKRLFTLKETELAALQQQVAKKAAKPPESTQPAATQAKPEATPETVTQPEPAPASQKAETSTSIKSAQPQKSATAAPAVKPTTPKPVKKKEPSLVSSVMDAAAGLVVQLRNYLLYIAGALVVAVLVFAGAYFVQRWRRREAVQVPQGTFADFGEEPTIALDTGDSTDMNLGGAGRQVNREAITILPGQGSETTQMPGTPPAAQAAKEAVSVEVADPLEEVNVFLAYEHFDQAEEFVRNALEKEPDNLAYHVKLLEVYYTANNKKSYEQAARVLYDKVQGKGDYWGMALAMWQVLSPTRALFAAPAAEEEDAEAPATKEAGGIVNITGDGETTSGGLDFDLDTTGGGAGEEGDTLEVEAEVEPDILDVTSAIATSDSEILDVTSAVDTEDAGAVGQEAITVTADDNALDFSLEPESKAANEDKPLDISLDLLQAESEIPTETAGDDEQALDFSLDLVGGAAEEEEPLDASLNILEALGEASAETALEDEQALEFSLDLSESEEGSAESSMDLEMPSSSGEDESSMDASHTGSSLLDVTSASSLDEHESQSFRQSGDAGEDMMGVSKQGRTGQSADLLDVTSATDFDLESGEDLLDVTFSGNVSMKEKDEDAALDFELAPDQPVPGDESAVAFDGIDLTASTGTPGQGLDFDVESSPVSAEDAFELDMDATMQIPSMRSALVGKAEADTTVVVPRSSGGAQSDEDEIATQMDLAKAYIELGNSDSAKTILDEIVAIGNDAQRRQAQELLGQIT